MPIIPDTKNWTWVLERPCQECGFDASAVDYEQIGDIVRENARAWPAVLARADVRERPNDHTWSPLEYSAHVRDVYVVFRDRLALMLAEDDPAFDNWDQDAAATAAAYNEQDPVVVTRELAEAAEQVAAAFDAVPAAERSRTGRRSDGSRFTVTSLARYFVHDIVHHLWDVTHG